jgi:hypothetical protein
MTGGARPRAGGRLTVLAATAWWAVAPGCRPAPPGDAATASASQPASLTRTSESGPVKASVEVRPAAPSLGDPLVLTLTIEAAAGVRVEPPPFGEALGRFGIVDFTPRRRATAGGGSVLVQTYTLQAPMSGRQRIPPLRIEFADERSGLAPDGGGGGGGGGDAGVAALRELLTEEITLDVKSVLPEGEVTARLRPARGRLPVSAAGRALARYWPFGAGALALAAAVVALRFIRRRAEIRIRLSAYDVALERLERLAAGGLPAPAAADAWYVELSDIVRRYLEDRYGVRAPELTTEEFLREAHQLEALIDDDRALLTRFLEGCDRVKFAGYHPAQTESGSALETARRFITQTRLTPVAS